MTSEPTSRLIYLCLAQYLERNADYLAQVLGELKNKITEDNVHEIRVTVRRLEACLELLNALGMRKKILSEKLHHLRKIHSDLRNIHVELQVLKDLKNTIQAKSLEKFLKNREKKAHEKLLKKLKHISSEEIHAMILEVSEKLKRDQTQATNRKAVIALEEQHHKVSRELEKAKNSFLPNSPQYIHKFRIIAKRLRYQREILQRSVHFKRDHSVELKYLQNLLGDYQNNVVLLNSIDDYQESHSKGIKSTIKLQLYLSQEQNELLKNIFQVKGVRHPRQKMSASK